MFNRIAPRSFESYFDKRFYSDVMHLRKPEKEIYQAVLDETGIEPSKTLFIDDNLHNLTAAAELGINTYHLQNQETVLDIFIE